MPNIQNVEDPFSRYTMPPLIVKYEGRGSIGGRTVISNLQAVAKSLSRPSRYILKFMSQKLGTISHVDVNERHVITGRRDVAELQTLLNDFIKTFVTCKKCKNPETIMHVANKLKTVHLRCMTCGHDGHVDSKHKLVPYIMANPPVAYRGYGNKSQLKTYQGDRKTEKNTSLRALQKRIDCLCASTELLTFSGRTQTIRKENFFKFHDFLRQLPSPLIKDNHYHTIIKRAEELNVIDAAPLLLCDVLLSDAKVNVVKCLKKHQSLFKTFTATSRRAQMGMLKGLETLIYGKHKNDMSLNFFKIFHHLVSNDVLNIKTIKDWQLDVNRGNNVDTAALNSMFGDQKNKIGKELSDLIELFLEFYTPNEIDESSSSTSSTSNEEEG